MAATEIGTVLFHLRRLADARRAEAVTDAELLARFARHRDEAAFAALIQRHGPMVFGVCRRVLGDRHDAEDAFQATFLILVRKAGTIGKGESLGCWLHEVACRTALRARSNTLRRRARERQARPMSETTQHAPAGAAHPLLDEEMRRLPEQYRRPLVLCYLEGKTHAEAAALLGWPKGTVSGRLARARDLLRQRLARRGVALTAGVMLTALAATANAAVPAPLLDATLRAGLAFASGRLGDGAAVTLASEVITAMGTHKLRLAVLAVALIGLLGGGWAYLAHSGESPRQTAPVAQEAKELDREPLPVGATARMGSTAFRHGDRILYLTYTSGGKRLVTASADGTVRLWDAATGSEIRRFDRSPHPKEKELSQPARKMPVGTLIVPDEFQTAVSADGKYLAATRNDIVIVWELESGKELLRCRGLGRAHLTFLAFIDGGKTLLVGNSYFLDTWDVVTGKPGRGIGISVLNHGRRNAVLSSGPMLSGDSKLLAMPYDDPQNAVESFQIYDLSTGKRSNKIEVGKVASSMAFSPDNKILAMGTVQGEVIFWDVATGKERGSLPTAKVPEAVVSLAFAPNGRQLALSRSRGAVELWDVLERKRLHSLLSDNEPLQPFHPQFLFTGSRMDLAFRPDGKRLAVGAFGNGVSLFDPATGKEVASEAPGHRGPVGALGLPPDGKSLVTYARGDTLRFWDLGSGKQISRVSVPDGAGSAALSPDGTTLAAVTGNGATGTQLVLYDTATGRPKARQPGGVDGLAPGLAFSLDGKTLAARGFKKQSVRIWDLATGKEYSTPEGEPLPDAQEVVPLERSPRVRVSELAFSPDGAHLALADVQDQLTLFEVASGIRLRRFPLERGQVVRRFGFSPDGRSLATVNQGGTVTLFETATGRKRARFGKPAQAPGLSPALMASAFSIEFPSAGEIPYALAFSPDDRLVAASGPGPEIRLWDLLTGQEVATFRGHQGGVTALAFDAAGRRLISGSMDTTALTWDVTGLVKAPDSPRATLPGGAADKLWADLAGDDAERAFAAIRTLCAAPADAVTLLRQRQRPIKGPEAENIGKLIADLNSISFPARSRATAELEMLGELIVPAARQALAGDVTLEARQRLEQLLKKVRVGPVRGEALAAVRGVEVLEHVHTSEARQVLRTLANGAAGAPQTEAARAALARLDRRSARTR